MRIRAWKPLHKGALRGFAEVELGELLIAGIAVIEGKAGLFAALPRREWQDQDGNRRRAEELVSFIDKQRGRQFSNALVAALERAHPEDFADNIQRLKV